MRTFRVSKTRVLNGFLHMGIRHYETYILVPQNVFWTLGYI